MNKGKICVSVCAETADEMIANIKRAEEFADLIEVRFDCLHTDQIDNLFEQIGDSAITKPLIATFRAPEQGGNNSANLNSRFEFWRHARKGFWAADLEEDVVSVTGNWAVRIASFHAFGGAPDNLDLILERLLSSSADVFKLAVQTNNLTDAIAVWKLLNRARAENKSVIPIAMGEAGKWTRILGLAHGAFMTYASLDIGRETADGQITAKDLIEIYRVKELDKNTKVYAVIGDPVSESLSTYMHNPAFVAAGLNAVFVPLLVRDLDEFMRRMVKPDTREVELNFGGFSVTMPHKQSIIKHLDIVDPIAEKIGAVNTVNVDGGKLIGYNTDAHGFITPLKEKFGDLSESRVAIFGAGGAARACVYALKQENADVTVFARDRQKAETFAGEFDVKFAEISKADSQDPKTHVSAFDIVVDATPLGMKGTFDKDSLFTAGQLNGVKFVYDLVTKPVDTPLICEAKKAGIPSIGGLEMLVALARLPLVAYLFQLELGLAGLEDANGGHRVFLGGDQHLGLGRRLAG